MRFDVASYWLGYGVAMASCGFWWIVGWWADRPHD